jgi:hypothetical protein
VRSFSGTLSHTVEKFRQLGGKVHIIFVIIWISVIGCPYVIELCSKSFHLCDVSHDALIRLVLVLRICVAARVNFLRHFEGVEPIDESTSRV